MNKFFLIFIINFTFNGSIRSQNSKLISESEKIDLKINRDSLKGENILYLTINNQVKDSLVMGDMDYLKDSLIQINDTLWHYIYSIGFDTSHNIVTIRQVLIQELNHKIHFSYVSDYDFHIIQDRDDPHTHLFNYKYTLILNDTNGYRIDMFYHQIRFVDGENSIDTARSVVFLDYDADKKIYYSSKDVLNGEYQFSLKEPKKRLYDYKDAIKIQLENEEVYSIAIGKSHYIYLEEKWFIFQKYPYHTKVISLLPIESVGQ